MAELKTAKDMPIGSQVTYRGELWTLTEIGGERCWIAKSFDHHIDAWLGNGAIIEFIPAGRGRWLKQEQEARRG